MPCQRECIVADRQHCRGGYPSFDSILCTELCHEVCPTLISSWWRGSSYVLSSVDHLYPPYRQQQNSLRPLGIISDSRSAPPASGLSAKLLTKSGIIRHQRLCDAAQSYLWCIMCQWTEAHSQIEEKNSLDYFRERYGGIWMNLPASIIEVKR